MARQVVTRNGKRYALVEPAELKRLERLAAKAEEKVPPDWPPPDAQGNRPAKEFARVSFARKIIDRRRALGLSQLELSQLAGVRQETISRLESGKHSPTMARSKGLTLLSSAERNALPAGPKANPRLRIASPPCNGH